MNRDREVRRAIQAEAQRLGLGVAFDKTGKHNVAVLTAGSASKRMVFACTTGDYRSGKNVISFVRRTARELLAPGG